MIEVTYEFYTNEYGGTDITESAFLRYSTIAGTVLNRLTFGRIRENAGGEPCILVGASLVPLLESEIKALQLALCSIMDAAQVLDAQEKQSIAGAGSAGNIASRTSGGESITYGSKATAYDTALASDAGRMALFRDKAMIFVDPHAFRFNPFYAGAESGRW